MESFRLDILRHGETTLSHTLRGSTDDALTQKGWQQMQQTIDNELSMHGVSQHPLWDVIVSSDLQRCREFASELSQKYNLPLQINPQFQEIHFGDWEALSTQHIYEQSPELLAKFWEQPTQFTPPNAESMQQFQQRIVLGLENVIQQAQVEQWQRVLLVSHGGVVKLLKCLALDKSLDEILTMSAELGQLNSFNIQSLKNISLMEPKK
ncbi:histidine phosphatase family protein [Acinetobacter sp. ANC 5054]|uniref:histidine phosphatase family protein n=1 Tax=Acinetobacter sp. ANC 5054 TaxID=1977877 RepID=UPI000A336C73|nr:histidine phosphatase family protein [Acinetobacter sp. ANC 5054]OTG79498.1 histidine phosphatase family protein [Acinetobacter sp. ANC 5054]